MYKTHSAQNQMRFITSSTILPNRLSVHHSFVEPPTAVAFEYSKRVLVKSMFFSPIFSCFDSYMDSHLRELKRGLWGRSTVTNRAVELAGKNKFKAVDEERFLEESPHLGNRNTFARKYVETIEIVSETDWGKKHADNTGVKPI